MSNPHIELSTDTIPIPDDKISHTSWDDIYEIIDKKTKSLSTPEDLQFSEPDVYLEPRHPYTVLYNFSGLDENDEPYTDALVCNAGDILYYADNEFSKSSEWTRVYCQKQSRHGYVPTLYIEENCDDCDVYGDDDKSNSVIVNL